MKISKVQPQTSSLLPGNVVVTSDPDSTIAYEATVEEVCIDYNIMCFQLSYL